MDRETWLVIRLKAHNLPSCKPQFATWKVATHRPWTRANFLIQCKSLKHMQKIAASSMHKRTVSSRQNHQATTLTTINMTTGQPTHSTPKRCLIAQITSSDKK